MSARRRLGQRETQEGFSVRAREPNDGAALAEGAEADAIAIQARLALSGGRRPGRHAWGARPGRQRRGHQFGAVGMIVLSVARDSRVPRP